LFRLFHLLAQVFASYDNSDEPIALLEMADGIGLFCFASDPPLCTEIFESLIAINYPAAVSNLVEMINESDRLSTPILCAICGHIEKTLQVTTLPKQLQHVKQVEFLQGIRNYLSREAAITVSYEMTY
jgi:hypothetical protein